MKKILISSALLFLGSQVFSQIVFKLNKPMLKQDWIRCQDIHFFAQDFDAILKVQDENGKIWTVVSERPSDPSAIYMWRPPIIPPGKQDVSEDALKNNSTTGGDNSKTLPVDFDCSTCSVITYYGKMSEGAIAFLQKLYAPYIWVGK